MNEGPDPSQLLVLTDYPPLESAAWSAVGAASVRRNKGRWTSPSSRKRGREGRNVSPFRSLALAS